LIALECYFLCWIESIIHNFIIFFFSLFVPNSYPISHTYAWTENGYWFLCQVTQIYMCVHISKTKGNCDFYLSLHIWWLLYFDHAQILTRKTILRSSKSNFFFLLFFVCKCMCHNKRYLISGDKNYSCMKFSCHKKAESLRKLFHTSPQCVVSLFTRSLQIHAFTHSLTRFCSHCFVYSVQ
jgi:hypothetical protein